MPFHDTCEVSIIIVNYNTKELLEKCIQSILEQTSDLSYEIIVIDNASSDGSVEAIKTKFSFPLLKIIPSSVNLGFGKANNRGVEECRGEYLFFLNSDTLLLNNAITILYHFLSQHPEIGICGGNLYDEKIRPNYSFYKFPSIVEDFKILWNAKSPVDSSHFNFNEYPKQVGYIIGADIMIKKSIFLQAKGFDPDFFMYYEETELTYRITQMGYKVYSVPQARIMHYKGMSPQKYKTEKTINTESLYSRFLYFRKTDKKAYPGIIKMIHTFRCYIAFTTYFLLRKKEKQDYWSKKHQRIKQTYQRYLDYVESHV